MKEKKQPKLKSQFHITKQVWFFIGVGILSLFLIWWVIGSFSFLVKSFNQALKSEVTPSTPIKFDIEGFKRLNLIPTE